MEIRYTRPYLSQLRWILNPIVSQVMAEGPNGSQMPRLQTHEPGLTVEITPYLGSTNLQPQEYSFPSVLAEGQTGPVMNDVLTASQVDVQAVWADALNSMTNHFPVLQDQDPSEAAVGLPFHLRLDVWHAVLPWTGAKRVTALLGVYETETFENVRAYLPLVFNDGDAMRQRSAAVVQLMDQLAQSDSILSDPPTYEGWDDLEEEQKTRLTNQATVTSVQAQQQLDRINAEFIAPLGDLFAMDPISSSLGALVAGIFATLKASQPMWADIDVAALMGHFALPKVD